MKLRKRVFLTAGYNTVSLGTGRKEFHPKKSRPGIEHYIREAGQGTLNQIGGAINVDEGIIGNFIASKYNNQANLPGFMPMIDEGLRHKPATRVEGACGSGGLALGTAVKFIMSDSSDVILTVGFEVQNSMKAVYGADVLAAAGWAKNRKDGHAHYFPGQFSDRAGAYYEKYGREKTRKAMAVWYKNAIENARLCETAQEYHNSNTDLLSAGLTEPNGNVFVDHLSVFDCSKVSDAACAIAVMSEEGLNKCNIKKEDAIEVMGIGQSVDDITQKPKDPTRLTTIESAVKKALEMANITINELGTIETHDCFSIAGIMATEAIGFADFGKGTEFVAEGNTSRTGKIPFNTTGGLIGWGHPVGATGIHQATTIWEQLTGKAGEAQIQLDEERPYGLTVNMGGDDITVTAMVFKKAG